MLSDSRYLNPTLYKDGPYLLGAAENSHGRGEMNGDEKSDKLETAPTKFVQAGEHEA